MVSLLLPVIKSGFSHWFKRRCAIHLQPVIPKSPDRSDKDLVEDSKNGCDQAFELLMRRHSGAIRKLIAHFHPDSYLVDDLAQDTFVKAFFRLKSYRGDAPFGFWLKKIAVRICLDQYRHSKAKNNVLQKSSELNEERFRKTDEDPNRKPANQIEARLLLGEIMETLSPLDRMILVLLYGEGYETKEISQLTGLSKANIKVRAYRIRQKLLKRYGESLR